MDTGDKTIDHHKTYTQHVEATPYQGENGRYHTVAKKSQFEKKDFNAFMRVVAAQAKQLQQKEGLPATDLSRKVL